MDVAIKDMGGNICIGYPITTDKLKVAVNRKLGVKHDEIWLSDEEMSNIELFYIEDNRVRLKKVIKLDGVETILYFDLMGKAFVNLAMTVTIEGGIIKGPITCVGENKWVGCDFAPKRVGPTEEELALPQITEYKVGRYYYRYNNKETQHWLYLGKIQNRHQFVCCEGTTRIDRPTGDCELRQIINPGFRVEGEECEWDVVEVLDKLRISVSNWIKGCRKNPHQAKPYREKIVVYNELKKIILLQRENG